MCFMGLRRRMPGWILPWFLAGVIAISCPDLDSVLALASKNILELFVLFLLKLIVQCPFTVFIFSCQDDH